MMWILWPLGVAQEYRSIMVSLLLVGVPLADEVFVPAVEHQLAALIMHRRAHDDHAGSALRQEFGDFQRGIERIARIHALEKAARLLYESYERIVDLVRQHAGAGCSLDQHLEAVREQVGHAARAAEFAVIVNRMVVAARRLEREEMRIAHGAAGRTKHLADAKILEPALLGQLVRTRIEYGHCALPPAPRSASPAACRNSGP